MEYINYEDFQFLFHQPSMVWTALVVFLGAIEQNTHTHFHIYHSFISASPVFIYYVWVRKRFIQLNHHIRNDFPYQITLRHTHLLAQLIDLKKKKQVVSHVINTFNTNNRSIEYNILIAISEQLFN